MQEQRSGVGGGMLITICAAAFWINCRGQMVLRGRPARIKFQESSLGITRDWTSTSVASVERNRRMLQMVWRKNPHECIWLAMCGQNDRWLSGVTPRLCLKEWSDCCLWRSQGLDRGQESSGMKSSLVLLSFTWWAVIQDEISARHAKFWVGT